jgi:lysophospholipase L1-like esterase
MQTDTARKAPLVVLGASYAGGWKFAEVGGVPVINAGVSGEQSFEMLARFDRDVVAARPRAVLLWGFINDVFRAQHMDATLARVRESYVEMVSRARAHGIEPILATEVTVRGSDTWSDTVKSWIGWVLGKESNADRINRHVMSVNSWLREFAGREGLMLIDIHAALADHTGARRKEFISADGSHITAAGYTALSQYALPRLAAHLSGRS